MKTNPKPTHPIARIAADQPGAVWVDEVYLDGEPQRDVVAASETEGWIVQWVKTEDGRHKLTPDGEEVERQKRTGEVRITLREEPRWATKGVPHE